MILRKRQQVFVQRCLAALEAHGNTLGTAPTGSGKTVCLSAVAGRVLTEPEAKVCILAHRDELTAQNRAKFSRVNPGVTTSVFDATEKSWDGQAVFAMVQTLSRKNYLRSLPPLRMLVVDECFPAGTSIDGRAIESIRAGDRVRSFDHQQGAVVAREVTRTFRRRPSRLLQLRFDDGSVLVCTPEHPLFAPQAQRYIPAHEMVAGQEVLHLERGSDSKLCVVWAEHRDHHQESAPGISADRASVLFGRLSGCDRTADQQPDDGPDQSPLRGGTDDPQQPNVSPRVPGTGASHAAFDATPAEDSWRQWTGSAGTAKTVASGLGQRVAGGVRGADQIAPSRVPDALQDRSGLSRRESRHRDRRCIAQRCNGPGARWEEGAVPATKRVVGLAVLEPGSDGRYGGLCPDGYVYNLEIAETHNYFADGVLVHNCHHAPSTTYRRVIDAVRERNPDAWLFGVTATPNRGDGVGLRPVFSNVGDQIGLGELIAAGHLVRPRTFVIDLGKQEELQAVRQTAADFDMTAVEAILNTAPINQAVVRHWREKAAGRKTIAFCSTVAHAESVCQAFVEDGIPAVLIHGELSEQERRYRLRDYEQGPVQVVVNVAVLTEGYDYPPTSCVVLLRPSSHASTFVQMVGRGLRVVDPQEFPDVLKEDCLVLDFGTASLQHGSLEQAVQLDGTEYSGEAPLKTCPACEGRVPLGTRECPLCGYVWERHEGDTALPLTDFAMTEIDLLNVSNFLWCDLFQDGQSFLATGFEAWAGVFCHDGVWHAVGSTGQGAVEPLGVGDRLVCLAQADDFLNTHETEKAAHKSRRWLHEPATENQLRHLPPQFRQDLGLTRYRASALLSFRFNHRAIRQAVGL